MRNKGLDVLEYSDFEPYLRQHVRIHYGAQQSVVAELISVTPCSQKISRKGTQRQGFSIVFRTVETMVLPQRIYSVEHAEMGELTLFLVPIGPDDEGMRYEAVFN